MRRDVDKIEYFGGNHSLILMPQSERLVSVLTHGYVWNLTPSSEPQVKVPSYQIKYWLA